MIFNRNHFNQAKQALQTELKNSPGETLKNLIIVDQGTLPKLRLKALNPAEQKKFGDQVLQLYFFQVLRLNTWILDLSPSSFLENGHWGPRPIGYSFQPEFLLGVRKVYEGLFLKNPSTLKEGLGALKAEPLEKVILEHFKEADTHPVQFTFHDFNRSGLSLIKTMLKTGTVPPKDSLALGVCLGFLYQTLSKIDFALDVSKAYRTVVQAKKPKG